MLEKAVWMGVLAIGSLTTSGCVVERYLGGEGGESGEGGHATIGTGEGAGDCGEVGAVGGHAEGAGGHSEGGGSATGEGGFGEGGFGSVGGGPGTGSGGQGGFEECVTCAEYITPPGGVELCPPSAPIYDALAICVCEGPCTIACGDNVCQALESSEACTSCILDEAAGCGAEYKQCADDV
jgi:hypothetical protein